MLGRLLDRFREARTTLAEQTRVAREEAEITSQLDQAGQGRLPADRLDALIDHLAGRAEGTTPDAVQAGLHLQHGLLLRYQNTGSARDLARLSARSRELLALLPEGHPGHLVAVWHRVTALCLAYEGGGGDPAHLDEVITLGRPLLDGEWPDPLLRALVAHGVGTALIGRFKLIGRRDDLSDGVRLLREACDAFPGRVPGRAQLLAALGMALLFQYEMSEDAAHLEEAVRRCREAARRVEPESAERSLVLSHLAITLSHAGRRADGDEGLLTEAVAASGEAVRTLPDGHPARVDILNHHVAALMWAGELLSRVDHLDEALTTSETLVAMLPRNHRSRGASLTNRATAARMRYDLTGDAADAAVAVAAWREVTEMDGATPWVRLDTAQKWAMFEAERGSWTSALEAYRIAVHTLPLLAHRGLDRSDQELHLARRAWVALASDAAACALNTGDPGLAVELLERGRGVIWAQSLAGASAVAPAEVTLSHLRAHWAVDGAAVLVNFSRWRSDALVVSAAGVRVVPLPGIVFDEAVDTLFAHLGVLLGEVPASPGERNTHARDLLEWAWEKIAEPVMTALGHVPRAAGEPLPRLWWCPTSVLSLVPLHAAGQHGAGRTPGETVMDRVVSSYTPTLHLLTASEPSRAAHAEPARLLVVAMPETEGHPKLGLTEREGLADLFPGERHTCLEQGDATVTRVRDALREHRYAHFGCHGKQDLAEPSQGGLILHDGVLTVAQLAGGGAHPGDLAFLAACETANGGLVNMDEAISLTAALRFAGWRDVIGSLWTANDEAIAEAAEAVFTAVAGRADPTGDDVARALHSAMRELRDLTESEVAILWAPFVHMGH
ncbi:CHAT domain-containing protein [Streptomyces sp. NPDC057877]|uniref:CHAT domain-containing protein n=1 Tax=Streptomyces sp. NPDC057877 TaxID=3346269 RepID=UPI0036AC6218